ncbi:MAG: cytochrome bc complex cytochrome b subunit [Bacteroidetes bacterium]|nr:cytochrome bc complex cytochrome b subunit [Bacteroidota bacterium]MCL5738402.1 cytochrome bc complex cytochrome b subunit [Bacteroidota bacterium]
MNNESKLMRWFNKRYDLSPFEHFAKEKKVPDFKGSFWYYFGGVSLFLFIVQVVTGILLLMYYQPGAQTAYESVRFIVTKVEFGWLIRSIHSWSANLMILSVFIHMFSVYFTKAFRTPRELTWYSGFLLMSLTLVFGFSGYLLPWNTLSYFATKVGTEIVGVVPVVGIPLMEILRNGSDVTTATLTRFFGLHVAVLPAVFTVVLGIHLLFIQVQGISEPESWKDIPESKKNHIPFFPNFVLRDVLLWLIVLNVLAILAVYFPWELGHKADPFASAPAGIKPEWYFLFMFESLKFLPSKFLGLDGEVVGVMFFGLAGLLWFLIPLWDSRTPKGSRNKIINYVGIAVVLYIIILTTIGAR